MVEKDSNHPLAEWILTDVADKTQLGTSERIREKMTMLSREVAKTKQEPERRVLEAERRVQEAERGREEAERGREEAERSREEAQIGREEAERRLAQMSLEERGGEGERHWLLQRGEIHMTNHKLGKGGWAEVKVAEFRGERVAAKVLYKDLQSPYYHDVFTRDEHGFSMPSS